MRPRTTLLLVASAVLVAAAGWYVYRTMSGMPGTSAKTPPAAQSQRVQTVNGETVVMVATDVQRGSHMEVAPLAASVLPLESSAYATVIDLQPLFDLRNRLAAARADLDSARAQADASRAQYERSRVLFADDRNVSQKSVQDASAAMQTAQAKLQSAEAAQNALEAILRQQFGDALVSAAMAPVSDLFQRLLTGRAVVVRVTLAANGGASVPAHISVDGLDGQPISARKLSASPQSDPAIQGNPYFYAADGALPVGTRTTAHVSLGDKSTGLLIPESAVVWYGGQPWVYVRTAADRFTRRYVLSGMAVDRGFVVTSGFRAGDDVVIRGAQLLLSEELRPQGITTQCKDPPECDD
jgi:multidrug efflux pump subunit AcrA (membrane-fusion protein)